jgi:hypothetical protein
MGPSEVRAGSAERNPTGRSRGYRTGEQKLCRHRVTRLGDGLPETVLSYAPNMAHVRRHETRGGWRIRKASSTHGEHRMVGSLDDIRDSVYHRSADPYPSPVLSFARFIPKPKPSHADRSNAQ